MKCILLIHICLQRFGIKEVSSDGGVVVILGSLFIVKVDIIM